MAIDGVLPVSSGGRHANDHYGEQENRGLSGTPSAVGRRHGILFATTTVCGAVLMAIGCHGRLYDSCASVWLANVISQPSEAHDPLQRTPFARRRRGRYCTTTDGGQPCTDYARTDVVTPVWGARSEPRRGAERQGRALRPPIYLEPAKVRVFNDIQLMAS